MKCDRHLESCDRDGFCNNCGEQDSVTWEDIEAQDQLALLEWFNIANGS